MGTATCDEEPLAHFNVYVAMEEARRQWLSRPHLSSAALGFGVMWEDGPELVVAFHDRWFDAVRYYAELFQARHGEWPADVVVLELEVPKVFAFEAVADGLLRRTYDWDTKSWLWSESLNIAHLRSVWRSVKLDKDAIAARDLVEWTLGHSPFASLQKDDEL